MKTFAQLLEKRNACDEAREWVGNKTVEEAVAQCPRGDWMLWLLKESATADDLQDEAFIRTFMLTKARIAETIVHLMTYDDSKEAVRVSRAFGEGRASEEELELACDKARSAYMDDDSECDDPSFVAYVCSSTNSYHSTSSYTNKSILFFEGAEAAKQNQIAIVNICRETFGELIIQKINQLLK